MPLHIPEPDICASVCLIWLVNTQELKVVGLGLRDLSRRLQLLHEGEEVVVVPTVIEHLNLAHKLHSYAMMFQLLAFQRNMNLGRVVTSESLEQDSP